MSKKNNSVGREPNKIKILVCNIIIALCCIASILTLILGDFMRLDITLTIDKATLAKLMSGESPSSAPAGIKADGPSTDGMNMDDILEYIPDDWKLEFNIPIQVESKTIAKSSFGTENSVAAVKDLVAKQVDNLVQVMEEKVHEVIDIGVEALIRKAGDMAKEKIKEAINEEGSTVTEADVNARLQSEGIENYEVAIDQLVNEVKVLVRGVLDGTKSSEAIRDFLKGGAEGEERNILGKVMRIAAKEELKDEHKNEPGYTPTDNEIDEKVAEYQKSTLEGYDEFVKEFADEEGNLNLETMIITLINKIQDEGNTNGSKVSNAPGEEEAPEVGEGEPEATGSESSGEIKSMDDVKAYVIEKIFGSIDEQTVQYAGIAMSALGYFLLFIMACWAYLLIKLIVKVLFCKNKTVGMFFPRMFGWIPHVLFIGLPMLAIKFLPQILERVGAEAGESLTTILNMLSVNFTSLTWVSALCTVILMVVMFIYYPERRAAKRQRKEEKRAAKAAA